MQVQYRLRDLHCLKPQLVPLKDIGSDSILLKPLPAFLQVAAQSTHAARRAFKRA